MTFMKLCVHSFFICLETQLPTFPLNKEIFVVKMCVFCPHPSTSYHAELVGACYGAAKPSLIVLCLNMSDQTALCTWPLLVFNQDLLTRHFNIVWN
jgi:hypothetical protein